jgi:hypothetical protein
MAASTPTPEPTPEQIELIMLRLLAASRQVKTYTDERALIRIGKRAGYLWTHRGCTSKGGFNLPTSERCVWCSADRPTSKGRP